MDLYYVHMICLKTNTIIYIFYIIQRDRDHYRDRDRHHYNRDRYGGGYGPPDHHRGGKFIRFYISNEKKNCQLTEADLTLLYYN